MGTCKFCIDQPKKVQAKTNLTKIFYISEQNRLKIDSLEDKNAISEKSRKT